MLNEDEVKQIKELAEEFLTRLGVEDFSVQVGENIDITLGQPQFLIGQEGKTLLDVQHILRMIIGKKMGQAVYLRVDINRYQAQKTDSLKKTARETADQVALTGLGRTLPPMSSYERRIVHAELAGRSDVVTKSEGEGAERRLTIEPK